MKDSTKEKVALLLGFVVTAISSAPSLSVYPPPRGAGVRRTVGSGKRQSALPGPAVGAPRRSGAPAGVVAAVVFFSVAAFVLADGRRITVLNGWNSPDPAEREFLRTVHQSACRRFGTTLGPDFNAAHRNHLHVDLMNNGIRH